MSDVNFCDFPNTFDDTCRDCFFAIVEHSKDSETVHVIGCVYNPTDDLPF